MMRASPPDSGYEFVSSALARWDAHATPPPKSTSALLGPGSIWARDNGPCTDTMQMVIKEIYDHLYVTENIEYMPGSPVTNKRSIHLGARISDANVIAEYL